MWLRARNRWLRTRSRWLRTRNRRLKNQEKVAEKHEQIHPGGGGGVKWRKTKGARTLHGLLTR